MNHLCAIPEIREIGLIIGTLYDNMVTFSVNAAPPQRPEAPPVCPKCGSHRTEVIGKSDDVLKRTVRCNACGAISTVPVNDASIFIANGPYDAAGAA